MAKELRVGVVGIGAMGAQHARQIAGGAIPRAVLAAVCDADPARTGGFGPAARFTDAEDMIRSKAVDALVVATPHPLHARAVVPALRAGLHVLVEKPVAASKLQAQAMLAVPLKGGQAFGVAFHLRSFDVYRRLRTLVREGGLGRLHRFSYVVTDWFRTHRYYASAGWRGTWAGEGGGMLLNQCPHNLDILQWLLGMPARVRAFCRFGRWHDIRVEDDVSAYLEWQGGFSGFFVASTGDAPGCDRLEIQGDLGRVVVEKEKVRFLRNDQSSAAFSLASPEPMARPGFREVDLEAAARPAGPPQNAVLENFARAALDGAPLLAPAAEGLAQVELSNAMLHSTFTAGMVELPLDAQAYERELEGRIAEERGGPGAF